jgi:hypothetical protein
VSNTAHFDNPSVTNVSNMSLNADFKRASHGFAEITGAVPLGRNHRSVVLPV